MANKRQQIYENLLTTFDLITVANGYTAEMTHKAIGYKHFTEVPEAEGFRALLVAGGNEKRENTTNNGFKSSLQVSIVGYVKSTDGQNPATAEQLLNKLIEDLTKALYVDPTRNQLAVFTEIIEVITDKGAFQPYAGFEMIVEMEYRATFAQP
jgi:hypothetical protein